MLPPVLLYCNGKIRKDAINNNGNPSKSAINDFVLSGNAKT
jgi:hypothetical protein